MDAEAKLKELQQEETNLQKQFQALTIQMQALEKQRQIVLQTILKINGGIEALESLCPNDSGKGSKPKE